MKNKRHIATPVALSLGLSLALHFFLLAGFLGTEEFVLTAPPSPSLFITAVESEKSFRPSLPGPPGVTSSSPAPSGTGDERQGESVAPGIAEPENTAQHDEVPEEERTAAASPEREALLPPKESSPANEGAAITAGIPVPEKGEPPVPPPDTGKHGNSVELLKSAREELSFDIYWLNIFVGSAELEAVKEKNTVRITSKVHSSPFLSGFYKVEDFAESTVIDGAPAHFRIRQREGKYRSDKETVFDTANKKVTFHNYLKGTRDEHAVDGLLWDVISGFYYLRTLLLETGNAVHIDIFDSNKFYKAEIMVLGRERLPLSESKEVDTVKVKPLLKSDGLFKSKGDIIVWLTDDEKRIPVMVETKVPIGKVTAKLTSVKTEQ